MLLSLFQYLFQYSFISEFTYISIYLFQYLFISVFVSVFTYFSIYLFQYSFIYLHNLFNNCVEDMKLYSGPPQHIVSKIHYMVKVKSSFSRVNKTTLVSTKIFIQITTTNDTIKTFMFILIY